MRRIATKIAVSLFSIAGVILTQAGSANAGSWNWN
jgi:hypothetical protein